MGHQSSSSTSWKGSGTVLTALKLPALFRCSFSNLDNWNIIFSLEHWKGYMFFHINFNVIVHKRLFYDYLKKFHSPLLITSRAAKNSTVTLMSTFSKLEWRTVCNQASLRIRFNPCMAYQSFTQYMALIMKGHIICNPKRIFFDRMSIKSQRTSNFYVLILFFVN